ETRLSWVFLTPDRAWKLKKPVRYDHLDLSALGARRADCEAEVRLNRPLAPDVYLGVEPLVWTADGHLEIGGGGRPVDFLVCMRRLANERCLENRIRAGHVDPDGVERAAVRLARFYGDAPAAGCVDPDFILGEVDGEAVELARLPLGAEAGAERLHGALHEGAEILREQLGRRQRREVHGDLRPQHIYPGDPPVFLDRLTFRQQLRLMDPVEELAFLALDCDRLGAGWVGERFLATYARIAGDDVPPAVVAWYRARRAHLWALLSGRHLLRGAPEEPWRGIARRYLELGLASIADVRG
ncbi:MAG: hypothetical protein ACOCP9_00035, partial [Halofilum sp. (in: g-proteobacteria)]